MKRYSILFIYNVRIHFLSSESLILSTNITQHRGHTQHSSPKVQHQMVPTRCVFLNNNSIKDSHSSTCLQSTGEWSHTLCNCCDNCCPSGMVGVRTKWFSRGVTSPGTPLLPHVFVLSPSEQVSAFWCFVHVSA